MSSSFLSTMLHTSSSGYQTLIFHSNGLMPRVNRFQIRSCYSDMYHKIVEFHQARSTLAPKDGILIQGPPGCLIDQALVCLVELLVKNLVTPCVLIHGKMTGQLWYRVKRQGLSQVEIFSDLGGDQECILDDLNDPATILVLSSSVLNHLRVQATVLMFSEADLLQIVNTSCRLSGRLYLPSWTVSELTIQRELNNESQIGFLEKAKLCGVNPALAFMEDYQAVYHALLEMIGSLSDKDLESTLTLPIRQMDSKLGNLVANTSLDVETLDLRIASGTILCLMVEESRKRRLVLLSRWYYVFSLYSDTNHQNILNVSYYSEILCQSGHFHIESLTPNGMRANTLYLPATSQVHYEGTLNAGNVNRSSMYIGYKYQDIEINAMVVDAGVFFFPVKPSTVGLVTTLRLMQDLLRDLGSLFQSIFFVLPPELESTFQFSFSSNTALAEDLNTSINVFALFPRPLAMEQAYFPLSPLLYNR